MNRNHLPSKFWDYPRHARTTLTKNQLKKTLNITGGTIFLCGTMWEIKSKELDMKRSEVWLEVKKMVFSNLDPRDDPGDDEEVYQTLLLLQLKKAITPFDFGKLNLKYLSKLRIEVNIKLKELTENDKEN